MFRRAISVGQKIPVDAPERCDILLDSVKGLQTFDQYYNIDETPCYFDVLRAGSYDFKGVQSIKLKTTVNEKLRFTVALTAGVQRTTNGFKAVRFPPLLIFKNLKKAPKGHFVPGVCVFGSKGGTMTQKMMLESYLPKILKRRPGGYFNSAPALTIMDSAICHFYSC